MTHNLRELTLEHHRRAERSDFVRRIIKKTITDEQYYVYLCNQLLCYNILEHWAEKNGILVGIENIKRASNLSNDIMDFKIKYGYKIPVVTDASLKYYDYVNEEINQDPEKLMAHIYVRHMGDLSGGQILKKLVPGEGEHYIFDEDVDGLKDKIRVKLHDGLADEARKCFDMVGDMFEDLEKEFDSMGPSD